MSDLEEKIRKYAIQEDILGRRIPEDEKIDFGYTILYPPKSAKPVKLTVLKSKAKAVLRFQVAMQFRPQDVQKLVQKDAHIFHKFAFELKKELLRENLLYNIDLKNFKYLISDVIYDSEISKDQFMFYVRRVFNMFVLSHLLLQETIGDRPWDSDRNNEFSHGNFLPYKTED